MCICDKVRWGWYIVFHFLLPSSLPFVFSEFLDPSLLWADYGRDTCYRLNNAGCRLLTTRGYQPVHLFSLSGYRFATGLLTPPPPVESLECPSRWLAKAATTALPPRLNLPLTHSGADIFQRAAMSLGCHASIVEIHKLKVQAKDVEVTSSRLEMQQTLA